jgi:hypothetical protein
VPCAIQKAEGIQAEGAIQVFRLKAVRLKVGVRKSGTFSLSPCVPLEFETFSLNPFSLNP